MSNLQILMNGVFGRKVPAEFAAADYDYESALHDELAKLIAGPDGRFNRYNFERNKYDIFELLSENLDEVLPRKLDEALNMFTEVMRMPQGSRPSFYVTRGKQRGRQFVTRATESGNYETFRLDRDRFDVYIQAIGGAGTVDFERYLDGVESITDIYEVLEQGFIDRIFEMVQEALLSTWNLAGRPARNKVVVNNFDAEAMAELCNTVAAYGTPVIYCSPEFASTMQNAIVYQTAVKISDQDIAEIRDRGYIGKFHGVSIVVMPQSFVDEKNEKKAMNPSIAYVIPSGKEKLVRLAFEGDSYFREWDDHEGDNSITVQAYTKVGVAIVASPNYWGLYYNKALDDGSGWETYNAALNA